MSPTGQPLDPQTFPSSDILEKGHEDRDRRDWLTPTERSERIERAASKDRHPACGSGKLATVHDLAQARRLAGERRELAREYSDLRAAQVNAAVSRARGFVAHTYATLNIDLPDSQELERLVIGLARRELNDLLTT